MQGHGHVVPRPDGAKARCGGPAICPACALELAANEVVGYKIGDRVYDPADVIIVLRGNAPQGGVVGVLRAEASASVSRVQP